MIIRSPATKFSHVQVIRVWFCNRRQRERRVKSVSTLQNVLNGQAEGDSTGLLLYAQSASANPEPDQQVANTNMSGGAEVTELTEGDDIHLNNLNSTMQLANEVQSINIIQPSDM